MSRSKATGTPARRVHTAGRYARGSSPSAKQKRSQTLIMLVGAAALVAVAALVVVGGVLRSGSHYAQADFALSDGRFLGDPNAPVLLTIWEDYQCPFCAQLNNGALKQIEREYVATGKVRFLFRNYAFLGAESDTAAEAAECANDQGKFWQYHDAVFASQSGENRGAFSKSKLVGIADGVGLNIEEFRSCLDSGKYKALVDSETEEGKALGVKSTPTTFVGNTELRGAQPYSAFKAAIEKELAGR